MREEVLDLLMEKINDPLRKKENYCTNEVVYDFDHKQFELEECVCNDLNKYITEELSISDNVKQASELVIQEINTNIRNTKSTPINFNGVTYKTNHFDTIKYNKKITIIYKYFNYKDMDIFKLYKKTIEDKFKNENKTGFDTISLTIESVDNYIFPQTLNDTIYHEMEHIFQKTMSGKPFGGKELYELAISFKNSSDIYEKTLANIIYLTRRYEQDAYVNGLYGTMIDLDDVDYAVRTSDVYGALLQLRNDYNLLYKTDKNDINLNNALGYYHKFNYTYDRFLKEASNGIININKKIGRIISKYKNDRTKTNDIHVKESYVFSNPSRYSQFLITPYFPIKIK